MARGSWRSSNGKSRLSKALFSARRDDWGTPQALYDWLDEELGPFDLDAAASHHNAKAPRYYTREDDALRQEWYGRVFLNPPYGAPMRGFLEKAVSELGRAEVVVCVVPCRTDTRVWHDVVMRHAAEIRFIRGRLRYDDGKETSPFPSCILVFRPGWRGRPRVCSADKNGRCLFG